VCVDRTAWKHPGNMEIEVMKMNMVVTSYEAWTRLLNGVSMSNTNTYMTRIGEISNSKYICLISNMIVKINKSF